MDMFGEMDQFIGICKLYIYHLGDLRFPVCFWDEILKSPQW